MNDVHALSDQDLADRLTFLEEVGSGNWGSVWKCRIKNGSEGDIVAVKLVHRSGGSNLKTSAARVRSLWNEMKTVRSFTQQAHAQSATSHPAIVPFSAFVITPSYALIEMPFFPRLVPVEVRESKARHWFRALADGVLFLHARGVVHNDIKPANILLTHADTPVLVDFGFAHRYDPTRREDAFISRLSYGTPEYLSPERAKGTPHDTRKSDVWALGVTFFEILEGRTPFERSDLSDSGGEVMATKEDLERYLARTVTGRWVGEWRLSPEVERLLRRMMAPTPSERATITSVVTDAYFAEPTPAPTPVPTPAPVSRTPKATNKAKAKAKAKSLVLNLGQPLGMYLQLSAVVAICY
ncbi:kinase-like domain-containing protein [Auriculariales sp. MPI-PUGE-AT-0066]|nr:kinase-like domain-containing protein [Auriculariales sp. MPI-PUGE-AT-0066]